MTDREELENPIEIIAEEEAPELNSFFEEIDDLDAERRYLEGVKTIKSIGKIAIKDDELRFKLHNNRRDYIE